MNPSKCAFKEECRQCKLGVNEVCVSKSNGLENGE